MKKTVLVLGAVLALTGCSAGQEPHGGDHPAASSSADTAHNPADVAFARDMITHHRQALEMSALAATKASGQRVKDLAARIERAQAPEIEQMTRWLGEWGQSAGPGHGAHGTMTDDEMVALAGASGQEFDRMFLEMMIRHHEGAVTMAKDAKAKASDQRVRDLADAVITAQEAEIAEMRALLA
ncbi:DUF305 domain-containing protein [Actinokineospora iranica]|uniref:Uncharacterized conserved protein, DUF305 family n=1 Tax=Actinokineospora iranica TaxID=1271860 RepID=A0A1G6YN56_9PSEU|nr:DUF305 domain-containing protein [Actinokineospora iranica]SDD91829.1 Uncharacterized conserved protein, DUF305 family [Actinokineospora iranica]